MSPKKTSGRPGRPGRPTPPADTRPTGSTRWTRWIAYALIGIYGIYWAVTAFSQHQFGNYAVETDFYWKYGPAAKDLLRGIVSIENYDSKGWGYPLLVAAVSLFGFEVFRAAQVVALLSALTAAWVLYRVHRSLFGPTHALASLALVLANFIFVLNTYEVGTDMLFLAVSLGSIALLLRSKSPTTRAIALSGLLGGFAFSTRYNALFLVPGALILLVALGVPAGPMRDRWRRALVWCGTFLLGALPWLIVNAIHTGNPLTNSNYVNVGYAVYGEGNWEKFFYGERTIHSLPQVILLNPGKFASVMFTNVFDHLRHDLYEVLPVVFGVLAVLGAALLVKDRPERRVTGYFVFGALCFMTLVPIFYGARFSLAILPFYAALAAVPLVSPTLGKPLMSVERMFPVRAFVFLLALLPTAVGVYGKVTDPTWNESVGYVPEGIAPPIAYLKTAPREPGEGLIARKPHVAFLSGLRFVPMPAFESLDSLHAVAEREHARYVLISSAEMAYRPGIRPLAESTTPVPGFKQVHESEAALVYEIVPVRPAAPSDR